MNAAVLCPGPSLASFPGRQGFDLVVAVNRAVNVHGADYLVALDDVTFGLCEFRNGSRPTLVSPASIHERTVEAHEAARHLPLLELDRTWMSDRNRTMRWWSKGLTVALVLAWVKGADAIRCFGVDWAGEADFDGYHAAHQRRDARRWAAERELCAAVVRSLADRNVVVCGLPAAPRAKEALPR